ncbi:hypothetical protein PV326_009102, partial [Microctonus aethiopoides]
MNAWWSSHYSSPPPEREYGGSLDNEHRSRRDMSTTGRKRAALMISRDQTVSMSGYQPYRKDETSRNMMGHRSHSAAPMDSPNMHYRGRSQSPTGHRSLSPPEHRSIPYSHGYMPARFGSRSATATPTGSPKKRQLPQVPAKLHAALKDRMTLDEERNRFMRHRNRQVHTTYRSTGIGGWERHYSGLSDSDLLTIGNDPQSLAYTHRLHRPRRDRLSPDKDILGDLGDSDMESIVSVASSAFSTQSERPRGSRTLVPTVKNINIPSVISPMSPVLRRFRRKHKIKLSCNECNCPISNISSNASKIRLNLGKYHNSIPNLAQLYQQQPLLVRSKSAVVRSLHKKSRMPFVRSFTVDENMLKYSSPETSDDYPIEYNCNCTNQYDDDDDDDDDETTLLNFRLNNDNPNNKHHGKFIFGSRAKSFDFKTIDNYFTDKIRDLDARRRAKSVEYDVVSSNIFSDDSMNTARRKVKQNLTENGENIPKLFDRSKSYYDSNGDILKKSPNQTQINPDEEFNPKLKRNQLKQLSKNHDKNIYLQSQNDHIYCSIDDNHADDIEFSSHHSSAEFPQWRRRTKSTDSYLDDDNFKYENTNHHLGELNYSENSRKTKHYIKNTQQTIHNRHKNMYDNCRGRSNSLGGLIADENESEHQQLVRMRMKSLEVPSFSQSKRMMLEKAESSPTLIPDDQNIEDAWEKNRRMSRRRRNSSCPEARDIKHLEDTTRNQSPSPTYSMGSSEDFGSAETVVGPDYLKNSPIKHNHNDENDIPNFRPRYSSKDYIDYNIRMHSDRSGSYPGPFRLENSLDGDYRNRKTSCPECTDHRSLKSSLNIPKNSNIASNTVEADNFIEEIHQGHRPLAYQQRELFNQHRQLFQINKEQQGMIASKRNVAISDTLEYYEYSMDSESQCSENCGFGPYDNSIRPKNRAPHPSNANSNIFNSQNTATSDTGTKNPRLQHHHNQQQPHGAAANVVIGSKSSSLPAINKTGVKNETSRDSIDAGKNIRTIDDGNGDRNNTDIDINEHRRSSGDYNSTSSSYDNRSRHQAAGNGHNGHQKRGQFSRSLSNADVPPDEKVADGSLSDTAVGLHVEEATRRGRKSSPGSKSGSGSSSGGGSAVQYQAGLGKKSNSTSQLSAT